MSMYMLVYRHIVVSFRAKNSDITGKPYDQIIFKKFTDLTHVGDDYRIAQCFLPQNLE